MCWPPRTRWPRDRRPALEGNSRGYAELDPELATIYETSFALIPFRSAPVSELEALRPALEAWDPEWGCSSTTLARNYELGTCIRPMVRSYLLGLVEARTGRFAQAERYVDELELFGRDGKGEGHAPLFEAEVRAEIAIQRGDTLQALRIYDASDHRISYTHAAQSPMYSHSYGRFRRAQLLESVGRTEEATLWFQSFGENSDLDLVYHGVGLLHAGQLLERSGQPTQALVRYQRAARFLNEAEGAFAAWLRSVETGLARLGT